MRQFVYSAQCLLLTVVVDCFGAQLLAAFTLREEEALSQSILGFGAYVSSDCPNA